MTGAQQHTNQCQAAHPPAYDQWNLTVSYLGIPCQPLMKGLIVSDRLWSAHRLFWNVNWQKKERAPWRVACRGEKGTPPSGEINATPVRHVSSGAWWILRKWKKKRKKKGMKKWRQRKESPFSSILASFCTFLPLRSSSPALILSTPFLMVTVRGAHLFCSVVFCCCHSGDASFLCICTSRQGWGGRVRSECWMEGVGKAWMPVVSADPDTPLGIGNQRTEGTLLRNSRSMISEKRDLAVGGGGCCKGKAHGYDIVDDNTAMTANECVQKP